MLVGMSWGEQRRGGLLPTTPPTAAAFRARQRRDGAVTGIGGATVGPHCSRTPATGQALHCRNTTKRLFVMGLVRVLVATAAT
jgi:hypothetical protein